MTVKALAYAAQQYLQSSTKTPFKRAHIYELLAALYGFRSYAALTASSVFTSGNDEFDRIPMEPAILRQRYSDLGYPTATTDHVVSELVSFATQHRLGVVRLNDLVRDLRDGLYDGYDFGETDLPALPVDCLVRSANSGSAIAHYALALIYDPGDDNDELLGASYWYTQEQNGRELEGMQKAWADAYAGRIALKEKHAFHLRQAAQLGSAEALLDLADKFGDLSFFEGDHDDLDEDPMRVAEIAERHGRRAETHHWLTIAAEEGNTEAMFELIERFDHQDHERCWTWIYLARRLGTDFTRSDYRLINEDGSSWDDDVGGSAFVIGRDALTLPPLDERRDTAAYNAAEEMFARLEST
ncbi:hypothetical protein EBL85_14030 [Marichromatium sp. AB32]|nr:hypothetical protein [Marichromatium gracile]RNE91334.1 hypothetical protein EBL85_14030 [Marichromatium sp. AB32]